MIRRSFLKLLPAAIVGIVAGPCKLPWWMKSGRVPNLDYVPCAHDDIVAPLTVLPLSIDDPLYWQWFKYCDESMARQLGVEDLA
jgi:hypothetical protein